MKPLPKQHAELIEQAIRTAQAAGDLPPFKMPKVELRRPKSENQGDYATPVAMQAAKAAKSNPMDIANAIAKHLNKPVFLDAVAVVKPGFINFRLSEDWLRQQVEMLIAGGEDLFQLELGKGKRAQVEFVSANPTGPLTVGRSRGAILGDAIARVLEAVGYEVEREYYFNNAGAQMRNLGNSVRIRYLEALGHHVTIPEDDWFYKGDYLSDLARQLVKELGNAWVKEDWEPFKERAENVIFEMIRASLARINIRHDVYFNENSLYETKAVWQALDMLDSGGYIYSASVHENADMDERRRKQHLPPAKWFRSTRLGDSQDRIVVKNDGSPTYTLPDIAYHANKLNRGFDLLVNILGADHIIEHQAVKYGVQALGMDVSKLHVIIHQMIHVVRAVPGTEGEEKEAVKMSTRRGEYVPLDEVVDETSPDVVRYMLLARNPNQDLNFDLDLAVQQSNENPVYYIQNAHVRCAGIFRQAAERGLSDKGADLSLLGEPELRFIRKALELAEQIEMAALNLEPHKIAFYAHELASTFHPIYDEVRALHSDVPPDVARARLRFYRAAQVVFKRVLDLMGMSAPVRM